MRTYMSTVKICSEPGLLLPDLCLLLLCVDFDCVSYILKENKGIFILSKSQMCKRRRRTGLAFTLIISSVSCSSFLILFSHLRTHTHSHTPISMFVRTFAQLQSFEIVGTGQCGPILVVARTYPLTHVTNSDV